MDRREKELPWHSRHKTAQGVAEYMRSEGRGVGREYRTHGSIWDAPNDLLQVGLLHLVVDRLEAIEKALGEKPLDMMAGQAAWLSRFHQRAEKAIKDHKRECARVNKICDVSLLRRDAVLDQDIHDLSEEYRRAFAEGEWWATCNRGGYYRHRGIIEIEEKVKRLKTVKTIDDIENLKGIGSSLAAKIRDKVSKQFKR